MTADPASDRNSAASCEPRPAGWLGNAWVVVLAAGVVMGLAQPLDRKCTRLNSSH